MLNVRMQPKQANALTPKITVIGVGGAGGNAVNNMISSDLQGVEFLVCNTDAQALEGSYCDHKLQLGMEVTGGLGAGAKPEIGQAAAIETLDEVLQYVDGSNMAFITAGMGGGTGTGAAPVIAKACREQGILTVGVVTKPFHFEGTLRMRMAEEGIKEMQQYVDTLIVIPNQNLFRIANEKTTFSDAFCMADSVLQSGVRGVTDLMMMPGLINLDFADIRSAMLEMGKAMMGTGEAEGERRAIEAAESAINNPLLDDVTMKGARGVIINVTGGTDMTLFEVDEACNRIRDEVDPNANIIFGSTFDDKLDGMMRVSIVATGIDMEEGRLVRGGGGSTFFKGTQQQDSGKSATMERTKPNTGDVTSSNGTTEQKMPETLQTTGQSTGGMDNGGTMFHAPSSMGGFSGVSQSIPKGPSTIPASRTEQGQSQAGGDLFEQANEGNAQTSTGPQSLGGNTDQNGGAARGRVYNESFIPPAPVDPGHQPMNETPYMNNGPALSAQKAETTLEAPVRASAGANLSLKPPLPNVSAPKKRKSASLFERFTNQILNHDDHDEQEESTSEMSSVGQQGGSKSGGLGLFGGTQLKPPASTETMNTPQASSPMAGRTSAQPASTEEELDIPAFLRRQAN